MSSNSSATRPASPVQHRVEGEVAGEGEACFRQWKGGTGEAGGGRTTGAEEAARVAAIGEAALQVHPQTGHVPPAAGCLRQGGFKGGAIGAVPFPEQEGQHGRGRRRIGAVYVG